MKQNIEPFTLREKIFLFFWPVFAFAGGAILGFVAACFRYNLHG